MRRKGDVEKTQQFTTFSDYDVLENDNLNLHILYKLL